MQATNEVIKCNEQVSIGFVNDSDDELFRPRLLCSDIDEIHVMEKLNDEEQELLKRCEADIEENMDGFISVGGSLCLIKGKRLYRETHTSFEAYHPIGVHFINVSRICQLRFSQFRQI